MNHEKQPHAIRPQDRQRTERNQRNRRLLFIVGGLLLALLVTSPLWIRLGMSFIPDRYIVAYFPVWLQEGYFEPQADAALPEVESGGPNLLPAVTPSPVFVEVVPVDVTLNAPTTIGAGQIVQAANTDGVGLSLRMGPGTDFSRIGIVAEGALFKVVDGPTLNPEDGFNWWQIADRVDADPTGWAAEQYLELVSDAQVTAQDIQFQLPEAHLLTQPEVVPQGWNNCGPATITTVVEWYLPGSISRSGSGAMYQDEAATFIKPNPEDRQTGPDELLEFARYKGLEGLWRYDGDLELLKRFINAGFLPVVEIGYMPEEIAADVGWTSHFLPLYGYDDAEGIFYGTDSYHSIYATVSYEELDNSWRQFNRRYLMAYYPADAAAVRAIIGAEMDNAVMFQNGYNHALAEMQADPEDPYPWYNLGTNLLGMGQPEQAVQSFEEAQRLGMYDFVKGAWRMPWYQFGPYEAYMATGRYDEVITLANFVLVNNEYSEEAYYYKGLAYDAQGNRSTALQNIRKALDLNPKYEAARQALTAMGG